MNCAVIRDLLPLYCDQVCSPESRQAVEEHLAGCPQCRAYYEKMAAPAEGGAGLKLDVEPVEAAKGFHRKLRRKRRRSVLAAVLAAWGEPRRRMWSGRCPIGTAWSPRSWPMTR